MLTIAKRKAAAAVMVAATAVTTTGVVTAQATADAKPDTAVQVAPASPQNEMPVRVLWSQDRLQTRDRRMPLDWPLAIVANKPTLDAATMDAFVASGELMLQPAVADGETVAVLVSPSLDIGKYWRPVRIQRDGEDITIVAEWWTDNEGRPQNIRRQSLYVMSLGNLKAGDYTFAIQVRDLYCDFKARENPQYAERSIQTAATTLHIMDAADTKARFATIDASDFVFAWKAR